jgi:hypothetical protein
MHEKRSEENKARRLKSYYNVKIFKCSDRFKKNERQRLSSKAKQNAHKGRASALIKKHEKAMKRYTSPTKASANRLAVQRGIEGRFVKSA